MAITVDIHCHTFNADDLPVEGFLSGTQGRRLRLLWKLLDRFGHHRSPGYRTETDVLDDELTRDPDLFDVAATGSVLEELDREAVDLMAELEQDAEGRELLEEIQEPLEPGVFAPEAMGPGDVLRLAKLVMKTRFVIIRALLEAEPEVGLFVPSLVDLEFGTDDWASTTVRQQVEMAEKISRLSMMGMLRAPVHHFVGFDPRREMRSRRVSDVESALDVVKDAVERYGFIGVKLYPPMGYRPFGNREEPPKGMTPEDGDLCDVVLEDFYDWCAAADVPITSHANPTNFVDEAYADFPSPESWAKVLRHKDEWGNLHINFGHFGGVQTKDEGNGWPQQFAALANDFTVYGDGSNHTLTSPIMDEYLELLRSIFDDPATAAMEDRFMLGSDWWMPEGFEPGFMNDYINMYRTTVADGDEAVVDRFRGGAALEFLGFAGVDAADKKSRDNQNRIRLAKRYEQHGLDTPSWLQGDA